MPILLKHVVEKVDGIPVALFGGNFQQLGDGIVLDVFCQLDGFLQMAVFRQLDAQRTVVSGVVFDDVGCKFQIAGLYGGRDQCAQIFVVEMFVDDDGGEVLVAGLVGVFGTLDIRPVAFQLIDVRFQPVPLVGAGDDICGDDFAVLLGEAQFIYVLAQPGQVAGLERMADEQTALMQENTAYQAKELLSVIFIIFLLRRSEKQKSRKTAEISLLRGKCVITA